MKGTVILMETEVLVNISKDVLKVLKELGADEAQCKVISSEKKEFNVDGGEFSLFRTTYNSSVSMTAFLGKRKGSITLNKFDSESIREAAENCIAVAQSAHEDPAWELASDQPEVSFTDGVYTADTDKLFFRTEELMKDISSRHPKIVIEQMISSHTSACSVFMNTNNVKYISTAGEYDISVMYSAHEGERASSFFSSGVTTDNLDTPFIDLAEIDKELSDVEAQLSCTVLEGKFNGIMLLPPGCLAEFISLIMNNFASDSVILEGTSIWKEKLGEKVADERINISVNPGDERIVCGQKYTGEGYIAEDFDFIKDGVLKSYILSKYVSNKTGYERAKNTSYALVVKPGDKSVSDIISSIDKGIIVGRFSGGEPGNNGDFSGVAKNSFLIENGRITGALSETMISGNLADLLMSLVDISENVVCDGNTVLPYMAFSNVTVSGN